MPVVHVTIHYAEFPKRAIFDKTDAYVKLVCGTEAAATAVKKVKDSTTITFEETHSFHVGAGGVIVVQLWDRDRITKDDLLAEGTVNCSDIVKAYGLKHHVVEMYGKRHRDLFAMISATIG
eukprot:Gregarina_sp_Poly_1__10162@NODE_698_length_6704_cov_82_277535_g526_i0_p4_GENE_NODE_698_length_6704_cov_82_277535_g526_i0NODE_698_length_6704_cov_82_277535_g526_i0_p4_ORF_typecomplete_len121_score12_68C2/PF00168_30/4_7e11TTR52/PF01060_23/1_2e03TTR52/PF01060_23/0_019Tautomerase/PF01361_21/8_1e03Tautomerase/PF01361_21/0_057CC2D2ANC2/PF15625_6/0_092_NODE_698_length_6704_cov_82_277535_g526_i0119481